MTIVEDREKLRECASGVSGGFQYVPDAVNPSLDAHLVPLQGAHERSPVLRPL